MAGDGVLALLGLVIEAPVFLLCFARRKGMIRRAAAALVAGNVATNIGVVCWYWTTGASSMLTALRPASPADVFTAADPPWVYYIASDERRIDRVRADGTGREAAWTTTGSFNGYGSFAWLIAVAKPDGSFALGLTAGGDVLNLEHPTWAWRAERDQGVLGVAVDDLGRAVSLFGPPAEMVFHPDFRTAADLRPEAERAVKVQPHWDGVRGVTIEGPEGTRSLALDNGFIRRSFTPCNVSVLPGDFLVFELNHEDGHTPRGIYVVSLRDNRIARLGAGRSPIVVYEAGVEGWVAPKER